jgi:hypothetical protein
LKNIISEHNRTMHDDNSMYIMWKRQILVNFIEDITLQYWI